MMKEQLLDAFLKEYSEKNTFSGSLRITSGDRVIYQNYYGKADFEKDIPFGEDSVFCF